MTYPDLRTDQDTIIAVAISILESRLRTSDFQVSGPNDAQLYVLLELAERKAQVFAAMFLDARNRLIEYRELFFGGITDASIHSREVVRAALDANAASVVFAHNHPSGDAEPSPADVSTTRRLADALELIDVQVFDHIIVGGVHTVSLANRGLL